MEINKLKVISILVFALAVVFALQFASSAYAISCSTNSDCPNSYPYGGQYCQSNSLYQTRIVYSCINSNCVSSQSATLIQTCPNICQQGLWYTGCAIGTGSTGGTGTGTTGGTTTTTTTPPPPSNQCYSFSYQKCVGNDSYWFDSCNVQGSLAKKCAPDQVCQAGSCHNYVTNNYTTTYNTTNNTNNVYTSHFSKGCQNNIVYWYDTSGNKGDVYQNCSYSGQLCQDGKCVVDPNPAPYVAPKPKPTPTPAPAPTPVVTPAVTTLECSEGKIPAQICISEPGSENENTQVSEQPTQETPEQNVSTAAVSEGTNPLIEFMKRWYVWLIVGAVLILFFAIIFKKSSSEEERKKKKVTN